VDPGLDVGSIVTGGSSFGRQNRVEKLLEPPLPESPLWMSGKQRIEEALVDVRRGEGTVSIGKKVAIPKTSDL
jgi:hypothetical protein